MKQLDWSAPTTDVWKAITSLLDCMASGRTNAWLEVHENTDPELPSQIKIPNPMLNDPFNWIFVGRTPRDEKCISEKGNFFNKTQEDLTRHWVLSVGTEEALAKYKEHGEITKGLMCGTGIEFPIRIEDANRYREMFVGDGYQYGSMMCFWTPRDDIEIYIPDPDVDKVFVVCYDSSPEYVDMKQSLTRAATFLKEHAETFANRTTCNNGKLLNCAKATTNVLEESAFLLACVSSSRNWAKATTNVWEAIASLLACINSRRNAWLEVRKNTDIDIPYPITCQNPLLDDPFNWTSLYGTLRNDSKILRMHFFNETEKNLTIHWISAFGTKAAIAKYKETGEITKDLMRGTGIEFPIRIEDANRYREMFVGDGYQYGNWMYTWKPKDGISRYIPDPNVGKVFVVCHDDTYPKHVDKTKTIMRAAKFLNKYAENF